MAQGTFHIITFGCQMNVNDSFWLTRSLQRRGFVESPLEQAEIVILNKTPITRATLEACPGIKYIGVLATGYNVKRGACPAPSLWSRDAWRNRSARAFSSVFRKSGWSWAGTGWRWPPTPSNACTPIPSSALT